MVVQLADCGILIQYAMRSFADALETIPMALAENSGLPGIAVSPSILNPQP